MPLPREGSPCHVSGIPAGRLLQGVLSARCLCSHFWQHNARAGMSKIPESIPGAEMILLALLLNILFEPTSGLSHAGSRAPEHSLHE